MSTSHLHVPSSFCDLNGTVHNSGHSHIHTLAGGEEDENYKANWEYGVRISASAADIFNIVCSDELHDELATSTSL